MKGHVTLSALWIVFAAGVAGAQGTPSPNGGNTESRPDAVYPHPSGQDSNPSTTQVPKATSPAKSNRPTSAKRTSNHRTSQPYTGSSGKKPAASTLCSTPQATKNGGVNCGTTGDNATGGKIVTPSK